MDKQESLEIFIKIHQEYNQVKPPKYRNIGLEQWREKYNDLVNLKSYLSDNPLYRRLVNGLSQIISKCEKLQKSRTSSDPWNNTSERSINKALPALIRKPGSEIEFPYEWIDEKSGHRCSINNGYWGARNYMVMDALGYFYLLKEGGDRLPENASELFHDLDSITKREAELNQNPSTIVHGQANSLLNDSDIEAIMGSEHCIRFDDRIFRKFTSLSMGTNEILTLLAETSRVEFRLVFPVRLRVDRKKLKERPYIMNMFSRLFEFGYVDKHIRASDNAVRGREYFVTFNTILGELFAHNLKTINFDWVREDLYILPNSAQIFFRKFILNNNFKTISINLKNIAKKLDLRDKIAANLEKTIVSNVLEPLQKQGFIKSYEKVDGLNDTKFIVHREFNDKK
jgi:hypothetical protein